MKNEVPWQTLPSAWIDPQLMRWREKNPQILDSEMACNKLEDFSFAFSVWVRRSNPHSPGVDYPAWITGGPESPSVSFSPKFSTPRPNALPFPASPALIGSRYAPAHVHPQNPAHVKSCRNKTSVRRKTKQCPSSAFADYSEMAFLLLKKKNRNPRYIRWLTITR